MFPTRISPCLSPIHSKLRLRRELRELSKLPMPMPLSLIMRLRLPPHIQRWYILVLVLILVPLFDPLVLLVHLLLRRRFRDVNEQVGGRGLRDAEPEDAEKGDAHEPEDDGREGENHVFPLAEPACPLARIQARARKIGLQEFACQRPHRKESREDLNTVARGEDIGGHAHGDAKGEAQGFDDSVGS
ncbi:hypothetical protein BC938DRAFT_473687 [Jimgerdemannia flammicorona]|uniref:Uncharacterized protein n=1 Tax=Jimgerdemannia flammicorona TaxID=994334 RepID=A0A433Q3Y2_9FUNG|nr:hypothetical protein BC938DRAFT_473687 [Jimgerdemannia flammicorona]